MSTLDPLTSSSPPLSDQGPAAGNFGVNVGKSIEQQLQDAEPHLKPRPVTHSRRPRPLPPPSHCNVGRTEQKIRLGMGSVLLAAAAFAPVGRGWRIGFAALGLAELITGSTRYCPVSQALGANTCRGDEA